MSARPDQSVLATLASLSGRSVEEISATSAGQLGNPNNSIKRTSEFIRISDLPRRDWAVGSELLAQQITQAFKTPLGTMKLKPIQAAGLYDLYSFGGAFCPINVGGGKTLMSFLAPAIVRAERPVLLVPASLIEKTEREFAKLRQHFKGPIYIRIIGYEKLGRAQSAEILNAYRPDLIICDEGHKLKSKDAAVTRRVNRYWKANPNTRFMVLSGTIVNRSLHEYVHLQRWCLPKTSFLPSTEHGPAELEMWSAAIDEKKSILWRPSPGAMFDWCTEEERATIPFDPVGAARKAFQRRMSDTPGVIATKGGREEVSASIQIAPIEAPDDKAIDDAFSRMRATWETPDGEPIADGLRLWQHARELACGFFYRWNPRPPDEWLEIRKSWAKYCRETLSNNRRGLDSELQVVQAVDNGIYPHLRSALADWRRIKPTFEPKTECVWLSDSVLKLAMGWMKNHPRGIVWTDHVFFGRELERVSGVPYYANKGLDRRGRYIEDHKGPMIASVDSNKDGKNLQFGWHQNLICSIMPTNLYFEQVAGRTHRPGQREDEVTIDYLCNCAEQILGFYQTCKDAKLVEETTGQDQKLRYGDLLFPSDADSYLIHKHQPRFRK